MLLIEPVWNRNLQENTISNISDISFNRTSLESKPAKVYIVKQMVDRF